MHKLKFEEAIQIILERDQRYSAEAYIFLRDVLDFTIQDIHVEESFEDCHVTGEELLEGFRKYTLNEFGPMSITLLHDWGIAQCEDVGEIVFNLVDVGIFGKQETDTKKVFKNGYNFKEAFQSPFLPQKKLEKVTQVY